MSDALHLDHVSIAVGATTLIQGLDLTVTPGEVVTIMGASGSGKSTLLSAIGGFLEPAFTMAGRFRIGQEDITDLAPERRRIGILFQDDLLFPHLSVAGNLAFGLAPAGASRGARRRIVDEALAEADLAGFGGRDPATLSGGQRARVALLRTLLAKPRAVLLDEPFGKLDRNLRREFRLFVFEHIRNQQLPCLLVTHDAEDAQAANGRVIAL